MLYKKSQYYTVNLKKNMNSKRWDMKKYYIFSMVVGVVLGLLLGVAGVQAADAPNMTGKWYVSIDSGIQGKTSMIFELQQDGRNVTGPIAGPLMKSKVSGNIEGSNFEFSSATGITYRGKIEGNKINGLFEGPNGKGTFTGERK